jgi:amidohydrolase
MLGTMRTFSPEMREDIIERMRGMVTNVAEANGATAVLEMQPAPNPVLENHPELSERAAAALRAAFGADAVKSIGLQPIAEDFAHVSQAVPSVFFWVGVTPPGQDAATAPDNHSDFFYLDETAIRVGIRSLLAVAVDYLQSPPRPDSPSK